MPEEKTTTPTREKDLAVLLDEYKTDIDTDSSIMQEQMEQANEDMVFIHEPGGMWKDWLDNTKSSKFERIKMEFDLTSDYRDRFIGNWNTNRVNVEFKPNDMDTSDEDADIINGIYRTDFRENSGKIAQGNAVQELADCGVGAYKIATMFSNMEDPEDDTQRIEFRPIPNAYMTVFWDSNAKWVNKRDAMRCTELVQFTKKDFERAYPDSEPSSAFVPPDWSFRRNGDGTDIIFIANRYTIVRKKSTVFIYNNLSTDRVEIFSEEEHKDIEAELKADDTRKFVRKRKVIKQTVEKSVFSGLEFLQEPKRIPGKWIPIIPMYGYRGFVDGVEWYHGFVRPFKDANRAFNMQVSQIMEHAAAGEQNKPIFDPSQVLGAVGESWKDLGNKPYAVATALRDKAGNIVQAGPIGYTQSAQLDQNTAVLLDIIPKYIQSVTGGAPQDTLDPNASGKAIQALLKRENLKTQPVMDNIVTSIEWSGEVYMAIAAEVYNTKRIVTITGRDDVESQKQLLEVVVDEETGKMIEANNINGKKFKVYSDVGPAFESQKEATVEDGKSMLELFANTPGAEQYIPAVIAMIIENSAGTNLGPLKDINRKNMIIMGLVKPETDEEKEMLAAAQEPKPDENAEVLSAIANQANADAGKLTSQARNLDADSFDNVASAEKKAAETLQIVSETENAKALTLLEIRERILNTTNRLPI